MSLCGWRRAACAARICRLRGGSRRNVRRCSVRCGTGPNPRIADRRRRHFRPIQPPGGVARSGTRAAPRARLVRTVTEHLAMTVLEQIHECGVIPVVRPPIPAIAAELGAALVEAGLPCIEITFRAAGARQAIERLRTDVPSMLVGAGTVLSVAQGRAAIAAGAQFLVSPGTNPAVVDLALHEGIPMIPGVATPSEIEANLARGIDVLKLFPAEVLGGVRFLKAVIGPYRAVMFVPTGGIDLGNLAEYLAQPNVRACGGSWITPGATPAAGGLDAGAQRARGARGLVRK